MRRGITVRLHDERSMSQAGSIESFEIWQPGPLCTTLRCSGHSPPLIVPCNPDSEIPRNSSVARTHTVHIILARVCLRDPGCATLQY